MKGLGKPEPQPEPKRVVAQGYPPAAEGNETSFQEVAEVLWTHSLPYKTRMQVYFGAAQNNLHQQHLAYPWNHP